jgi:hypothetical protein
MSPGSLPRFCFSAGETRFAAPILRLKLGFQSSGTSWRVVRHRAARTSVFLKSSPLNKPPHPSTVLITSVFVSCSISDNPSHSALPRVGFGVAFTIALLRATDTPCFGSDISLSGGSRQHPITLGVFRYFHTFSPTREKPPYICKKTCRAIRQSHLRRTLTLVPLILLGSPRLSSDLALHAQEPVTFYAHGFCKSVALAVTKGNIRTGGVGVDLQKTVLNAKAVVGPRLSPRAKSCRRVGPESSAETPGCSFRCPRIHCL